MHHLTRLNLPILIHVPGTYPNVLLAARQWGKGVVIRYSLADLPHEMPVGLGNWVVWESFSDTVQ